ncbi:BLUF domain-containing protein [Loktanella agnita]|uniref:BLUF domain-containing protein n=1 Tax=Loktanella agnita TaxID=287097 RepID=UPI0039871B0C
MIRVLYFSTAEAELVPADVDNIVSVAQECNAKFNITGALTFNGRNFCQVLEGEEKHIRVLLDNIAADSRHSGFKIIDEKQVTERHFADWSMLRVDGLDFSTVINAMNA